MNKVLIRVYVPQLEKNTMSGFQLIKPYIQ